jgi:hypothetical protein
MPAILPEPTAVGVEESVETVEKVVAELRLPVAPILAMTRFHSARKQRGDGSLLKTARS